MYIESTEPIKAQPCVSPYHYPPTHLYIPPGTKVEHRCPACGFVTVVKSAIMIGKPFTKS